MPAYSIANEGHPALSFVNVVETHVLDALRRTHRIAMYRVSEALTFLEQQFPSKRPLADQNFETRRTLGGLMSWNTVTVERQGSMAIVRMAR
jgi:hypothetical protein